MLNEYRYDSTDPQRREKLGALLKEVGVNLPHLLPDTLSHLIEHLIWRKTAPPLEDKGNLGLSIFLDLGEGDEVLLLTLRANKVDEFSHAATLPEASSSLASF